MRLFRIFFSFFIVAGLFFGISLFFPRVRHIDRTITINKPAEQVFVFMNDLRNWEQWSLWNKETDSTLKIFYGRRSDSLGGRQYFSGSLFGTGRFEINRYKPNEELGYNLYMHEGMIRAINGKFLFIKRSDQSTEMHWIDDQDVGYNPFLRYLSSIEASSTERTFDDGLLRIKKALERK